MGFAEEMGNLGENFIASSDNRIKEVGGIFHETHNMRKRFHKEHGELSKASREMSRRTREFLKRSHNEHLNMAREQRKNLRKFCRDNSNYCHNFLDQCHNHMESLRKGFDQGHRNFKRAMNEINRHRKAASFPTMSTRGFEEPRPSRSPPRKKRGTKKRRRVH